LKHTDATIVLTKRKSETSTIIIIIIIIIKLFVQSYRAFMLKIRTSSKQCGTYIIKLLQKPKNLLPSLLKFVN